MVNKIGKGLKFSGHFFKTKFSELTIVRSTNEGTAVYSIEMMQ